MMRLVFVLSVFVLSCAGKNAVPATIPSTFPIAEQAETLTLLPDQNTSSGENNIEPIEKGQASPMDGFVMDEATAERVANLRIDYNEAYMLAESNQKYLLTVIKMQEEQLYKGDVVIDRKERELNELRNSWWGQNKMLVGLGAGLVCGVALSFGAGAVWANIK